MWSAEIRRLITVSSVDLRAVPGRWAFADRHAAGIDAHWAARTRETPQFFNGTVHVVSSYSVSPDGRLSARFLRTDFKSFLYWREQGFPDPSVADGFGSALLFSADGKVLAGRQRGGHLNGGLTYPPSGFIDIRDIDADGAIDIEASVLRETREELGLAPPDIERLPGFIVALAGPVLAIGVPFALRLSGAEVAAAAERHIRSDPDPELECILFLDPGPAPVGLAMPDYARVQVEGLAGLKTFP